VPLVKRSNAWRASRGVAAWLCCSVEPLQYVFPRLSDRLSVPGPAVHKAVDDETPVLPETSRKPEAVEVVLAGLPCRSEVSPEPVLPTHDVAEQPQSPASSHGSIGFGASGMEKVGETFVMTAAPSAEGVDCSTATSV